MYPGAWRRIALRETAFLRYGLFARRSAAFELRAAADVEGGVHPAGDGRSARCSAVFHLRRHPQYARAATLEKNLEQVLQPIELDEVLRMGDAGAQILDVRDPAEYAKGHLAGSINIGLGGQYATWAGTVLDRAKPIVIIAEPAREQEAALRLGRIGFDHVKGYLRGGMEALADRPDLVWPTERVSAPMMAEELASADPPLLLDIRNPREWATKHIEGSVNIPLNHLQERIARSPPRPAASPFIAPAATGPRSPASILHQYGITHLIEMAGGLAAWDAAQLPVVSQT